MSSSLPPPIHLGKPLPRACRSRTLSYEYGLVKFHNGGKVGLQASGQTADFDVVQVGTLDAHRVSS
jgi:hypothetical protein